MSDEELLKSFRLFGTDRVTGEREYNLAAIMLFGKDDAILDVAPAYLIDALLRKFNIDRYDDREIIQGKRLSLWRVIYIELLFR